MRKALARVVVLLMAGALCTSVVVLALSQEPSTQPSGAIFKSDTDLVVLHVNVFDRRSDAVPDLPQHAFLVLEDDVPQQLTFFSAADVPVAVGLVLDNSASMITRRQMVIDGGRAFVYSSHPEDELFAVVFNEHVRWGLPQGVPFTKSREQLTAALGHFRAGGQTAIFDAVIAALDHLEKSSHQKRVLVVLSDGEDNASSHSKAEMLERAARSDAIVYTVSNLDHRTGSDGDPAVLRDLAEVSGGVAYFARSAKDVVSSFEQIASNIRRGYSLGYVPAASDHDAKYHRVRVIVRMPGYKNLNVRARDGYTSPGPPDTH